MYACKFLYVYEQKYICVHASQRAILFEAGGLNGMWVD